MAKTTTKKPANPVEETSNLSDAIFHASLKYIRDEIDGIASGKIKPKGHDPASRIAWLAERASKVAAEQRKAEAAEASNLRKLSRTLVVAWIRQLPVAERSQLLRELGAIDQKGSVLS